MERAISKNGCRLWPCRKQILPRALLGQQKDQLWELARQQSSLGSFPNVIRLPIWCTLTLPPASSADAFGDPPIQLRAAKAPGSSKLERRNLAFLGKAIDRPFPGFEVGRDLLKREDLALDFSHPETIRSGLS
jgi:hypothetical protein